jgi:hypothetical protein
MGDVLLGLFGASERVSWVDAAISMLAAFIAGQILAWVYEATYSGLSYSRKFADTLTLLTTVCAGFVLIARQSLIVGLGLMAVLSIIRFRTNVKAPADLVFVLASATFGLGAGLGALAVTAVGFAGFAAFALFVNLGSFGSRQRFDAVVRLRTVSSLDDAAELESIFERHCLRSELLSTSEIAQGEIVEHSYQIKLLQPSERQPLLASLRDARQVHDVRILLQELNLEY